MFLYLNFICDIHVILSIIKWEWEGWPFVTLIRSTNRFINISKVILLPNTNVLCNTADRLKFQLRMYQGASKITAAPISFSLYQVFLYLLVYVGNVFYCPKIWHPGRDMRILYLSRSLNLISRFLDIIILRERLIELREGLNKSRERHNISRELLIKSRDRLIKSRERHNILRERLNKSRELLNKSWERHNILRERLI